MPGAAPMDQTDGSSIDGELSDASCSSDSSTEKGREIAMAVREDMTKLERIFEEKSLRYRLIDRIGEGTFSTVYKAEDLMYDQHENTWDAQSKDAPLWSSPHHRMEKGKVKPRYVAVKKIYVTSSPTRIFNELELLHKLKGCDSVCPLITAFRYQDQVVAVLPHFRHQDFRLYYRRMNMEDLRRYLRSMLKALEAVHSQGIIHRDVKPTNFLYDVDRQQGVLVDFGLAERQGTEWSHCLCQDAPAVRKSKIQSARATVQEAPKGYPKDDQRPSRRANRAGTRGFRAPEVLLKCTAQTTKLDIWSVGVIVLTVLAQRFPFFNSADDVDAMVEMATIFGRQKMKACALLHGTTFDCSLNTVGERGHSLMNIVQWSTSISRDEEEDFLSSDVKDAVEFMEALLELDPKKRVSASEALKLEFIFDPPCAGDTDSDEMDVLS